jgi:hypothetical protein
VLVRSAKFDDEPLCFCSGLGELLVVRWQRVDERLELLAGQAAQCVPQPLHLTDSSDLGFLGCCQRSHATSVATASDRTSLRARAEEGAGRARRTGP